MGNRKVLILRAGRCEAETANGKMRYDMRERGYRCECNRGASAIRGWPGSRCGRMDNWNQKKRNTCPHASDSMCCRHEEYERKHHVTPGASRDSGGSDDRGWEKDPEEGSGRRKAGIGRQRDQIHKNQAQDRLKEGQRDTPEGLGWPQSSQSLPRRGTPGHSAEPKARIPSLGSRSGRVASQLSFRFRAFSFGFGFRIAAARCSSGLGTR
ncbi:hypothetical protein C8R47DRAFT_1297305 [Mycena vitilis]|nr:hypothetical protein C8R47DRAFT_1297305 [Mycena vitilis]